MLYWRYSRKINMSQLQVVWYHGMVLWDCSSCRQLGQSKNISLLSWQPCWNSVLKRSSWLVRQSRETTRPSRLNRVEVAGAHTSTGGQDSRYSSHCVKLDVLCWKWISIFSIEYKVYMAVYNSRHWYGRFESMLFLSFYHDDVISKRSFYRRVCVYCLCRSTWL